MPRRRRTVEPAAVEQKQEGMQAAQAARQPTWRYAEAIRCRCPVCGHMPSEEEWSRPQEPRIELYRQRFGGAFAASEAEGRPRPSGFMEYEPLPPGSAPQLVKLVLARLKAAADRLLSTD